MVALIKKSYFPSTQKCRTDVPPETKTRVLTLLDLAPAFLIFGIGLSISLIAFLIEIIANCVFGKKQKVIERVADHKRLTPISHRKK